MLWPERCPPTFGSGPACWSASPRVPPGRNHHRVAQLGKRKKIAAVERDLNDLPVFDNVADFRRSGLEERRPIFYRYLLGQAFEAECEFQSHRAADFESDLLHLQGESR
jgi:hypothetical protein